MNVNILPNGEIIIGTPLSNPGDRVTLRAEMDLYLAVAACSAGVCNNNRCKPIDIEIIDH